ncbi:hypothetical protein [Nocardia macrotermitis]|uniref:Uncharacterized protein n=1 Tax=Nocardia macrotermitis TaxID=2585198 RepID=A0A7K0DC83_9NOCA|nr:hypothetical protein [Nocardia macrotermitis]MQY22494.1 hypothetical protein [Nocardia macrotermitis]
MTGPVAISDTDDRYEMLLEMFCASMRYVPELTDSELVAHAADDLIDQVSYPVTVTDFRPVFAHAVDDDELPPGALAAAENHTETTILAFLRQLLAELDRRRPWPDPALVPVDPEQWPALADSVPIAWLHQPLPVVEQSVRAAFDTTSDAVSTEAESPLLVLRLRELGQVALLGEQQSEPGHFLVLLPDGGRGRDPAAVLEYLTTYTGLPFETAGIEQSTTTSSNL